MSFHLNYHSHWLLLLITTMNQPVHTISNSVWRLTTKWRLNRKNLMWTKWFVEWNSGSRLWQCYTLRFSRIHLLCRIVGNITWLIYRSCSLEITLTVFNVFANASTQNLDSALFSSLSNLPFYRSIKVTGRTVAGLWSAVRLSLVDEYSSLCSLVKCCSGYQINPSFNPVCLEC